MQDLNCTFANAVNEILGILQKFLIIVTNLIKLLLEGDLFCYMYAF